MTNLDSTFKSRDVTLPTKVHLVKAMVFPVGMLFWSQYMIRCLWADVEESFCKVAWAGSKWLRCSGSCKLYEKLSEHHLRTATYISALGFPHRMNYD